MYWYIYFVVSILLSPHTPTLTFERLYVRGCNHNFHPQLFWQQPTYAVSARILRIDGILHVFHLVEQFLVKAVAVGVVLEYERLQYEPETSPELCQLFYVLVTGKVWTVYQQWHGEHQHVVRQDVWKLGDCLFYTACENNIGFVIR